MNTSKQIKCFKYLVFSYIILLLIVAAIEIVFGTILLWGHLGYALIIKNYVYAPSTLLICTGVLTLFTSWFGWNATSSKKQWHLGLFGVFLILLICVLVFICAWSLIIRHKLSEEIEKPLMESFLEFVPKSHTKTDETLLWNRLQSELQCCGVNGPADYQSNLVVSFSCLNKQSQVLMLNGCKHQLSSDAKVGLLKCSLAAAALALFMCTGVFCVFQLNSFLKRLPREHLPTVTLRTTTKNELSPLSNRNTKPSEELKKIRSSRPK